MLTGTSEGAVNRKPRRLFGKLSERKNPVNAQFERQVALLESRQQQQQRCIVLTVIPVNFYYDFQSPSLAENGNTHPSSEPEEGLGPSSSSPPSPPIFFIRYLPDESHRRWPDNSSRLLEEKSTTSDSTPNSDFLVKSFTKPSVNARHTARRKNKKKSRKQKQRCRKPTGRSEDKSRESNGIVPPIDVGDCEDSTLSPKRVGDILFDENFSPSSSVKEASEEAPESENDNEHHCFSCASVSSASYCDEIELSRSKTACPGLFGQYTTDSVFTGSSQETCHAADSVNSSHDINTLLIFRDQCEPDLCETTEYCSSSSGVDDHWLEKFDYGSSICSQNGVSQYNGFQAVHVCSDTSSDSDFHLVISRKRARKEKKMSMRKSYGERGSSVAHGRNEKYTDHTSKQMTREHNTEDWSHIQNHVGSIHTQRIALRHPTKNLICKPGNVWTETQNGGSVKDFKLGAHLNGFTHPKENNCGNSVSSFSKVQHAYLNIKIPGAVRRRESSPCEMKSDSCSEPIMSLNGSGISESSKPAVHTIGALLAQKRGLGLQDSIPFTDTTGTDTISGLRLTCSKSNVPSSVEGNHSCQEFFDSGMHLAEMMKVVNDAYKMQVAADAYFTAGCPITDLESFIHSATPVVGHIPCMKSSVCSGDQEVRTSRCQHDISNVSLRRIWEWYEEPGCYGLEVRAQSTFSSKTSSSKSSDFLAYFVPYLSAVQLFGWSSKNTNHSFSLQGKDFFEASNTANSHPVHAKLHKPYVESNTCLSESSLFLEDHGPRIFEYFETEQPSFRPPLFEKIKDLVSNANGSGHRILGDPEKLQNVKLCDLHPASWYCVAWYPVYRVPHGKFRAAFLTYHSLGKLVSQKCHPDMTCECNSIISPVVGLQSYNDKGEQWFHLRCPDFKQSRSDDASEPSRAEVLKERLRTLKKGALAMARAVIPNRTGDSVNHHPDYEFFLSRCT